MNRRTLLPIILLPVAAAGCARLAVPSPFNTLAYVATPMPLAVYQVTDTRVIAVTPPQGDSRAARATEAPVTTASSSMVLHLTLAGRPGGVRTSFDSQSSHERVSISTAPGRIRVTGLVKSFEATVSNPVTGEVPLGNDDVAGDVELVIDRRGIEKTSSFPEFSGAATPFAPLPALAHALFPRLPADGTGPGSSWVDTVTTTSGWGGLETTLHSVNTYTLAGDTVIDDRVLTHIAVTSEVTVEQVMDDSGMRFAQTMEGSVNGLILWSPERRLVAYAEYERDWRGTTAAKGEESLLDMRITGPTTIWLVR
ncbi:MAG: hypothetical protein OXU69_08750 [Gemmatimonadota bacterium]|nr:hypothetical protein [Gemmatimonadota bacterium]MDE2984782.1 hypothetical protein [Gemmatimonadota bacterium]